MKSQKFFFHFLAWRRIHGVEGILSVSWAVVVLQVGGQTGWCSWFQALPSSPRECARLFYFARKWRPLQWCRDILYNVHLQMHSSARPFSFSAAAFSCSAFVFVWSSMLLLLLLLFCTLALKASRVRLCFCISALAFFSDSFLLMFLLSLQLQPASPSVSYLVKWISFNLLFII